MAKGAKARRKVCERSHTTIYKYIVFKFGSFPCRIATGFMFRIVPCSENWQWHHAWLAKILKTPLHKHLVSEISFFRREIRERFAKGPRKVRERRILPDPTLAQNGLVLSALSQLQKLFQRMGAKPMSRSQTSSQEHWLAQCHRLCGLRQTHHAQQECN